VLQNPRFGRRFLAENARLADARNALPTHRVGELTVAPAVIHVIEIPADTDQPLHTHNWFELSFVVSGRMIYRRAGWPEIDVAAGAAFLMPPETAHGWRTADDVTVVLGLMTEVQQAGSRQHSAPALAAAAAAAGHHLRLLPPARQLLAAAQSAVATAEAFQPETAAAAIAALLTATLTPLQQASGDGLPTSKSVQRRHTVWRVARHFIDVNLAAPIQAEDVARYCDVSLRHLNRIVVGECGMTAWAYTQQQRLARAKQLLLAGRHSVKAVGIACGYPDPPYFNRVFRAATGTTPGRFATDARSRSAGR
jgi:AraC-like DNA-binding protein/quercetin dioxygenase-like cupin family protein